VGYDSFALDKKEGVTMSKRLWMTIILALGLVLLLADIAMTGQKYSSLIGTWSGTENWLSWDGNQYSYNSSTATLVITNQENGLFYGTIFDNQPITGNITTKKIITATASAWGGVMILNAKLSGKTIDGTFNYFAGDGDYVEVGNFKFTLNTAP
jgi:hypothetical protein